MWARSWCSTPGHRSRSSSPSIPGQSPQAVNYVPAAVPEGDDTQGLQALGIGGESAHLTLVSPTDAKATGTKPPTSVSLFDQGLLQVLQASVTRLKPKQSYGLALS